MEFCFAPQQARADSKTKQSSAPRPAQPQVTHAVQAMQVAQAKRECADCAALGPVGGGIPMFLGGQGTAARKCAACAARRAKVSPAYLGGLPVSHPEDPSEIEADRVADRIMNDPAPAAATRAPLGEHVPAAAAEPGGRPLDPDELDFFEPRLGRDLSPVRLHTGPEAARSASSLEARAYTVGRNVVFGEDQYTASSDPGRRLLAHELAHVVQQSEGGAGVIHREYPDDVLDAGVSDAGASSGGMPTDIEFENRRLTDETGAVRRVLEDVQSQGGPGGGEAGVIAFVDRFRADVEEHRFRLTPAYLSDVHGVPDWIATLRGRLELEERILPMMQAELHQLRRQNYIFLRRYEAQARITINAALAQSTERATSERQRYGLTEVQEPEYTSDPTGDSGGYTSPGVYSMENNPGSRGLAGAARHLAHKLRRIMTLRGRQAEISASHLTPMPPGGIDLGHTERVFADPEFERITNELHAAQRDYNLARFEKTRDYPILAASAPDPTDFTVFAVQALERIGAGPNAAVARNLWNEIDSTLRNIRETQNNLRTGALKVWSLPNIIDATNTQMGATMMQRRLVQEKVDLEAPSAAVQIALSVLALGLGLIAAIPTGGASLGVAIAVTAAGVGAAAISTYIAIEHIREYEIQAAAHGTDFEKSRAISREDPSLFWLALDLIGAGMDIFGAGAAFRGLMAAARRAIQLRRAVAAGAHAAEAERALRELAEAAEHAHPGHGLGQRVTDDVIAQSRRAGHQTEAGMARWEESINQNTRGYLVDHPGVRGIYADMDDRVRSLLTHCSDFCIIANATRRDAGRVRALIDRLQLDPEQLGGLREYFHLRRNDLPAALAELEAIRDPAHIRQRLTDAFRRAEAQPSVMAPGTTTAQIRAAPGAATGGNRLPRLGAGDDWLRATGGEVGLIPGQVAERLRGRQFNNWGEFQQAFWEEVGRDPVLSRQFGEVNVRRMTGQTASGEVRAPIAPAAQQVTPGGAPGPQVSYTLHHVTPLEAGGGLYDLDNIVVVSPAYHGGIHNP